MKWNDKWTGHNLRWKGFVKNVYKEKEFLFALNHNTPFLCSKAIEYGIYTVVGCGNTAWVFICRIICCISVIIEFNVFQGGVLKHFNTYLMKRFSFGVILPIIHSV